MNHTTIEHVLENQSLKSEFELRNLDLSQVFRPTPSDLVQENRTLRHLLKWAQRYSECQDRATMEAEGYAFPPVYPAISPWNDWYRFEEWMQGRPVRQQLKERLPADYTPKSPEQLTDEEIIVELEQLERHLADCHIGVSVRKDVPPRLLYAELLEYLEEESYSMNDAGWFFDGCTGYCPGCFQRPWCDAGLSLCWREDEEAGEIHFIPAVKAYVSPSPVSLPILQELQAEKDRRFAEFKKSYANRENQERSSEPFSFPFDNPDEIPF